MKLGKETTFDQLPIGAEFVWFASATDRYAVATKQSTEIYTYRAQPNGDSFTASADCKQPVWPVIEQH